MSPELAELLDFHATSGIGDDWLLRELFMMMPEGTFDDGLAWVPDEWRTPLIQWTKKHYDNDVAVEDIIYVSNTPEPPDLRDRIRRAKLWIKEQKRQPSTGPMTVITPDQAGQRGLPSIGFSVDMQAAGMTAHMFRFPGQYLTGSAGPGSPQSFGIFGVKAPAAASLDLAAAVRAAFTDPRNGALELGSPCSIRVGDESRPAIAFSTGAGITFTSWCGTTFHASDGVILIAFGYKGTPAKTPAEIFSDPSLRILADSLRIIEP
jgi:hypothetical protein